MPPNVRNAESAYLRATARRKKWAAKFGRDWNKPETDATVVAWWDSIPEQLKEVMRAQSPGQMREIEGKVKALKGE